MTANMGAAEALAPLWIAADAVVSHWSRRLSESSAATS